MNKSIRKGKSPLKKRENLVDSVSATELLQALHTLQHISIAQEQLDENLNISFSQNDNFSQANQICPNQQQPSFAHTPSKINKSKNPINKNHAQNDNQNSKMNFEFYMTKKQNKYKNKSSYEITNKNNNQQIAQRSITPRKKLTQNAIETYNKSVSPLTQRSMNISKISKPNNFSIVNKQLKVKKQTFTPAKSLSKVSLKNVKTEAQESIMMTNKNKQNLKQIKVNYPNHKKETQKQKLPSSILQLSIHQRNKEFLKQKNQKLAKLSQEMEEKKKQQQKQCTFKPKIICDNSHIKSKYNDLCASRQFYEKTHKRCKTGKQNIQNCFEEDIDMKKNFFRENTAGKSQLSQSLQYGLQLDETAKMSMEQCDSRVKGTTSVYQKDEENKSMVKKKYKNSKFNILLDLIH